jgi:hypothetical protein
MENIDKSEMIRNNRVSRLLWFALGAISSFLGSLLLLS